MAYRVESYLPHEPILVITYWGDNIEQDIPHSSEEIAQLLKGLEGPIYRIVDFSGVNLDFTTAILGLAMGSRGGEGSFSDPRMRPIFVGTQEIIKFAADAAKQEHYGKLNILAQPDVDSALAYARAQISTEAK